MSKKNKTISLFGNNTVIQNEGVKYSDLLNDFIKPFEYNFPDDFYLEDIIGFSMNAWNFGNLSLSMPKYEFEKTISSASSQYPKTTILKKMIDRKVTEFKEYDRYIVDFWLEEVKGDPILTVVTGDKEDYLNNMVNKMAHQPLETDYEEGYINRYAIVLVPQKPFLDWINKLYPDDLINEAEANIYLLDEGIDDLEKWLRKKYDKFFKMELDEWHTSKKDWPYKRSYKMFNQWFKVEISKIIYDLEKRPIYKEQ